MKRSSLRIASAILIISLLLSIPALAADTVQAAKSDSPFIADGVSVQLTAYLIAGNNYVRLRDVAQTVNFGVYYDASTRSAYLSRVQGYDGEPIVPASDMPDTASASLSDTPIYVDGERVYMTAYMIGGNNFVKLREIAQAIDFNVWYESGTRTVYIDSANPYVEEFTEATGSGRFSSVPLTVRYLDGTGRSREDFSQKANPAIFTATLTREAYNAVYQTLIDRDAIFAGNDSDYRNPYYDYAYNCSVDNYYIVKDALNRLYGEYYYYLDGEPITREVYKYPGYYICKVSQGNYAAEEATLSDGVIAEAKKLGTDREKVELLNNYLCERMVYDGKGSSSLRAIFAATKNNPVPGACGTFAGAFKYLCDRAGIPCVSIIGDNHVWNAVYVEGRWLYVDVSANCNTGYNWILLTDAYTWRSNEYPAETLFAMELLVPGSTK